MIYPHGNLRPIEKLARPLVRFLHIEAASGIVLLAATIVAMTAANTAFRHSYADFWSLNFTLGIGDWALSYPLWYWVNDGLMTVFFFLVGLEIKREMVTGELREVRRIISPIAAAVGGAIVPAAIYLVILGGRPGDQGWAIPMATDIAFVVGALALLGKRVPHGLKVFLLTLAIVDDIIAVLVIAVFYSSQLSLGWLAAAIGGVVVVIAMNRLGVRTVVGYLLAGSGVWLCTLNSGIHPTISGVVLGLLTPAIPLVSKERFRDSLNQAGGLLRETTSHDDSARVQEIVEKIDFCTRESISPLERLEASVHPWAAFVIMPIFALANAGVPISLGALTSPMAIAVAVALLVGKPVGIIGALFLTVKSKLGMMPGGSNWGAVLGVGSLAGIGFTMSLFVASLSLTDQLLTGAKVGILAGSATSGAIGFAVLLVFLKREAGSKNKGS